MISSGIGIYHNLAQGDQLEKNYVLLKFKKNYLLKLNYVVCGYSAYILKMTYIYII